MANAAALHYYGGETAHRCLAFRDLREVNVESMSPRDAHQDLRDFLQRGTNHRQERAEGERETGKVRLG